MASSNTTDGMDMGGVNGTAMTGDRGPMVLAVCWTMTAVAALFLGARLSMKLVTHKKLWWDDWLLAASWCLLVAFTSTTTYGVKIGIGRHHLSLSSFVKTEQLQLVVVIATVFSVLGAAWSKTSFALTLLRITDGLTYYFIWFIVISMNIVLAFNAILQFIWCHPASAAWNAGQGGTCWSKRVIVDYSIAAAAYSAGMDILLAMIPWTVISRLRMHKKERLGVGVCMSLGIVAAITSIFRAYHIPSLYTHDFSYDEASLFVWTAAEMATTIIATSIPMLRPLLKKIVTSTTQRNRRVSGSQFTNTFRTGTYACSAVSGSQSYRRMGDGNTTSTYKGANGHLGGISESGESVTSLVITSEKGHRRDLEHGGILKTEEIKVDYDRRSQHATHASDVGYSTLGFELEEVSPVHIRSNSR